MNRSELEHAIRAACDVAGERELVVIGSQAVLGQFPRPPAELTYSQEVDLFPSSAPERAEVIDGALGDRSLFHHTHGFYVHGIGPETATLPDGWRERLVPVSNENTRFCTGWCLEVHDIAASKLAAGREKDLDYVAALFRHRMVDAAMLGERIGSLPVDEKRREHITRVAERLSREG